MESIIFEQRTFGRVERTFAFILGFSVTTMVLCGLFRINQTIDIIETILSILLITVYITIFLGLIWVSLFVLGLIPRYKVKLYTNGIEFMNSITFQKSFYTWNHIKKIEKQIRVVVRGQRICYFYVFFVSNKRFKIELLKDELVQLETVLMNTNKFNFKNKELIGSVSTHFGLPNKGIMQIIPKKSID